MSITPIALTGQYRTPTGAAATGTVRFTLTTPISQPGQPIIPAVTEEVTLDGTGSFSVTLFATNDPATVPVDAAYEVIENVGPSAQNRYWVQVPFDAAGGTTTLSGCPKVLPTAATDRYIVVESGGGGGGSTTDMPIADVAGITTSNFSAPDPLRGSDFAQWVQFPSDGSVMAWGLAGDGAPRVMIGADPTDFGVISMGDGTSDPTSGARISTIPGTGFLGPTPVLGGYNGDFPVGAILGNLAITGSGLGSPNGYLPGGVGDIVWTSNGAPDVYFALWSCTNSGPAGTAFWRLVSVLGSTDPTTAAFVPPNKGAIWQDFTGGVAYISNGVTLGSWVPLATAGNSHLELFSGTGHTNFTGSVTLTGMSQSTHSGSDITLNGDTQTIDIATVGTYQVGFGIPVFPPSTAGATISGTIVVTSGTLRPATPTAVLGIFVPSGTDYGIEGWLTFVVTAVPASFTVQVNSDTTASVGTNAGHVTVARVR